MKESVKEIFYYLLRPVALWRVFRDYFSLTFLQRDNPVTDSKSLKEFISSRASYVSQVSLYGYLRTRAGTRYPELFENDEFVVSINIAKWQLWLECVSDLAVYAGGLLVHRQPGMEKNIAALMLTIVNEILNENDLPVDAGDQYNQTADHVRKRVELTNWPTITDDEGPFTHSPQALVDWAPVIDEFKEMDSEIIINSVRFRWQQVRRDLRKLLDANAVLDASYK